MAPHVSVLSGLSAEQGRIALPLDPAIAVAAGLMDWPHRDPFDRLLAATAQHHNLPIISTGTDFGGMVQRVW